MTGTAKAILAVLLSSQIAVHVFEATERVTVFSQAKDYANSLGKPLLVVGTPKKFPWGYYHPCGDVTIDLDPNVNSFCEYEVIDVRALPFPDIWFGAAYISHVLEHLPTVDDAYLALSELHRVADKVFVVSPHKTNLTAWLHPDHHLWVLPDGDGFIIEQRGRHS